MKKLLALLLVAVMVCAAFAGCGSKTPAADPTTAPTTAAPTEPTTEPTEPTTEPTEPTTEPTEPVEDPEDPTQELPVVDTNATYAELFSSRNIEDKPAEFAGLESMAYATVTDEGMLTKMEIGYKDGIVNALNMVLYVSTAEMTEGADEEMAEQITSTLDSMMKESMAAFTDLSFCTGDFYFMDNGYYVVNLLFNDLNNIDNVKILSDGGMAGTSADGELLTVESFETEMTEANYVKR